ncbi:MAG: VWA domain-containing protein [Acidobacteria bacterium]|nr:VWA domain-containing protein [Acidobacteriota bacterium]
MNREVGNRTWWMVLGTFVLLAVALNVSAGFAQQGSEGPNQDAGEVVLAPRRPANTRPAPIEPIERPEKIDIDSTFSMSVSTNLVNMDVVVTDKHGNFIPTLKQGNFRLYEDGVEQSITNFSRSKGAMTVCMLIEFRNTRLWWNLYEAIRSSYQFVNFLQPDDYVAVVAYDLHPEVLTDFTQNRNQIIQALNRLRVPGFSEANLYDSLEFAIDSMKDIKTKKAILLITTGIDTFSKMTYGKALKMVRETDTIIYPVAIGGNVRARGYENITNYQADNALKTFAKYTGGLAFFPRFRNELPGIYQVITAHLKNQYSLGYVSSNTAKDGKFRKVKVLVVDEQGNPLVLRNQKGKKVKLKLYSRQGYTGPKS